MGNCVVIFTFVLFQLNLLLECQTLNLCILRVTFFSFFFLCCSNVSQNHFCTADPAIKLLIVHRKCSEDCNHYLHTQLSGSLKLAKHALEISCSNWLSLCLKRGPRYASSPANSLRKYNSRICLPPILLHSYQIWRIIDSPSIILWTPVHSRSYLICQ